jgi:putative hydrolase of the HAD superfamily
VTEPPVAVLWDFGGVLTTSPFDAFTEFEQRHGLPLGLLRTLNSTNPDTNAWASLERGDVDLDGFVALFEDEAAASGFALDARALMVSLGGELRQEMVEALRRCHDRLSTGLLTNNFATTGTVVEGSTYADVIGYFDVVVESSKCGYRKPDRRFYEIACERMGIEPAQAVFLDDLGVNLKPARAMGMRTIKVTDPAAALDDLEAIVGFPLRD